jgi:PAS domain S-box-containing protein
MRRGEGGWLSWQAIDSKQCVALEDYAAWPQRRQQFSAYPIHAIMIAPIIQREQAVGSVNYVRTREGYPFSEMDISLGQQLAQIVALMLDNSQVYLQLRNELAERKQMQEELRISQENFMSYFNTGAVGMSVTTPSRNWVEVNDQLCRMLGYSKEELRRLTWSELTHPDDLNTDMDLYNQAMRGERDTYQIDKRFIRRDGGILYVSLSVACQRFPDGSPCYFLASLVDISERVKQKSALRAALEQLAEQHRTVAVIEERQRLARELHDSVSQSLHGLNLFAETLTISLSKDNKERTLQLAERLQESARQALKEARLMLYQLQPSEMDAEMDLVHEIEGRLSSVEQRAGVRASVKVEGDAGQCPQAWRENLFRITIEALNNSLKHAQARNVKVTIRYEAAAVQINIADDGIGFDPRRARKGGMGLRTMRERADLLGGALEIQSSPGAGTSVTVRVEKKETP